MVIRKHRIITVLGVLVAVLAVYLLLPGENKKVKRQFDVLSQTVQKEAGEDLFSMAHRIRNIGQLFAETCEFKIEGDPVYSFSGTYSREEISGYVLRGRSHFLSLSLRFHDFNIEFPEKGTARVNLTAVLSGKSTAGERVSETRELLCTLNRIDRRWFFSRLEVVEVLKR